jgi:thiazole synthase
MDAPHTLQSVPVDPLVIAGRAYGSRLLVGTGKYRDFAETRAAVVASGAQIVTVAIRRTNIGQDPHAPSLLDALPPSEFTYLPNTAGCYTADDAVRTLQLARELLDGHTLVKLEVLGDPQTLFPNVRATIAAAQTLVRDGFEVLVYTSDDPIIARELEAIGCVAIMPLASLAWASSIPGISVSSSKRRRCRCWSMPAWAPPRMPRSRWSWAAPAC